MSADHPASFRRYLRERLTSKAPIGTAHFIAGDAPDLTAEVDRLNRLLAATPIDAAFVGIGENGHLAFNDPPADFTTEIPYIVVTLDEACRRQQFGEGWFKTLDDVPREAISMTVRQIMKAGSCAAPVHFAPGIQAVCFPSYDPAGWLSERRMYLPPRPPQTGWSKGYSHRFCGIDDARDPLAIDLKGDVIPRLNTQLLPRDIGWRQQPMI